MLPIEKYPKFLSPSSLSQYEKMPITFYLTRMAPDPMKISSDSYASSLGTAIDAEIKLHICRLFGWEEKIQNRILDDIFDPLQKERCSKLSLEQLLFENIKPEFNEALLLGRAVGKWYVKTPMFASLSIVDIEYHPRFNIYNTSSNAISNAISNASSNAVPIYCKLDVEVEISIGNYKCRIPLDIKSTSGSPEQGYYQLYDKKKGFITSDTMPKHKLFRTDLKFDEINQDWDNQLLTYHMALKYKRSDKDVDIGEMPTCLPAMIEQICIGSSVRIARFVAACGSPTILFEKYSRMWQDIHSNKFTDNLLPNRMLLEYFASIERFY